MRYRGCEILTPGNFEKFKMAVENRKIGEMSINIISL